MLFFLIESIVMDINQPDYTIWFKLIIPITIQLLSGNINQSLLTLGRVITALVEHAPHVPYR